MGNKFHRPVRHNVRKQGQKPRQYGTIQAIEGNSMITREKLIHHIEHLKEKHSVLDRQIDEMYKHHTDDLKVEELKKQRLKLKDEIEETNKRINSIQ